MMLCMPALLFPHMLPRLHAFDPQSTAHCTSSHNGQTRASASPRTGRPLWVSSRRIPISVEAVSTSSEVPTFPYPLPLSMTEHFWVLVLLCPLTRPSARRAIPWSDVVFLPPEARSQPVSPQPHKKGANPSTPPRAHPDRDEHGRNPTPERLPCHRLPLSLIHI